MSDPSSLERGGIRVSRADGDDGVPRLTAAVVASGASITTSIQQAHELLDSLAVILHRPDLVVAHRHQPAKRPQPGMPPTPASIPRPAAPNKEEQRNYDH